MSFFKNLFKSRETLEREKRERDQENLRLVDSVLPVLLRVYLEKKYADKAVSGLWLLECVQKDYGFARDVWRRCIALACLHDGKIYPNNCPPIADIMKLATISKNFFIANAPKNAYGKSHLKISPLQLKKELDLAKNGLPTISDQKCFIYLGKTTNDRVYVGQTIQAPEERYLQHKKARSGPFKTGQESVEWKILKECEWTDADYWESYFIGVYDATVRGYNENRGNSARGFSEGTKVRATQPS
jgi:predicted GIY-YIG superfamily endonuclease